MTNEQLQAQVREAEDFYANNRTMSHGYTMEDYKRIKETQLLALRFMEKMLGEPSADCVSLGADEVETDCRIGCTDYMSGRLVTNMGDCLKAMVQQALEELSNDGAAYNTASMLKKGE